MIGLLGTFETWSDQLAFGLLVFALRATVLLLLALLATRLLRRAAAATRHLVWSAAVAGVLLLPLLGIVLPAWNVPVISIVAKVDAPTEEPLIAVPQPPEPVRVPVAGTEAATPAASPAAQNAAATPAGQPLLGHWSASSVVGTLWLAIAGLLLLRLAVANARLSGWKRASTIVEDGRWNALMRRLTREYRIERPVVLLQSEDTDVPVTWGVVYPVVLIPASADDWDEEQRGAVLTHELAHVKRFDALSQMIGQVVLALLWFHPLAWMAVRRMRQEREHACDDFVLAAGARASRYADDLLGLARRLTRPTVPAAAALAMARRSELEGRLLAILDPAIKRGAVQRGRVGVLAFLLLLCVVPLSAFRPAARVSVAEPTRNVPDASAATTTEKRENPLAKPHVDAEPSADTDAALSDLDALVAQMRAISPAVNKLSEKLPALQRVQRDTEPQWQGQAQQVDVATLLEVTRAAKRMSSDYEKGQLLALIAKRYVKNDSLRDAYLDAVFTMTSDYERSKALIQLLQRDSIPSYSTAKVLRSTKGMTSDASRSLVLKSISPATFADTTVQRAYVDAMTAMTSDYERAQAIGALVTTPGLSQPVQLALLRTVTAIQSSTEKGNVLLIFAERQGLGDETVRRAFMNAAATLNSDYDYRRVMTAIMK